MRTTMMVSLQQLNILGHEMKIIDDFKYFLVK
jgi:hypothetical protein